MGSLACLCLAIVAFLVPGVVGVRSDGANAPLFLFAVWPVLLGTVYIALCGPEFHSHVFGILFMITFALLPVWFGFRRAVAAALGF